MHFRNVDGCNMYQDPETRRTVFWISFKNVMIKVLVFGLLFAAFALYSFYHPVPEAVRNVANVDRKEAAREAIELYSEAHPEFTHEEIEEIFKNVIH